MAVGVNGKCNSHTMRIFYSELIIILTDPANAPDPAEVAYNGMHASAIDPFPKMAANIVLVGIEHISHVIRMIVLWI